MLQTASSLLTHFKTLTNEAIDTYQKLTKIDIDKTRGPLFERFKEEHIKQVESVERAYRETVSDAYSIAFLANPLDEKKFSLEKLNTENDSSLFEYVMRIEDMLIKYSQIAGNVIKEELPEVAHALYLASKKGKMRLETLRFA